MPRSGRYQSQLFSFLSQQSLRLRDQVGRTFRQAKVAVNWGTQVVLYPVYALFQTSRLVGKQLREVGVRSEGLGIGDQPPLQAGKVEADRPVRRTLEALQELGLPVALPPALPDQFQEEKPSGRGAIVQQMRSFTTNLVKGGWLSISKAFQRVPPSAQTTELAPRSPRSLASIASISDPISLELVASSSLNSALNSATVQIQGIATLLETRAIVLTTPQNDILDILTHEQQALLQRRITYELATYWHNQRRLFATQQTALKPLPLPGDRPQLLPPVRWFRRLMAWMQTSPVAAATNLFQETALLEAVLQRRSQFALPPSPLSPEALPPKTIPSFLGQSFAQWVTSQLKTIPGTSSSLTTTQPMPSKPFRRVPPGRLVHAKAAHPVKATSDRGTPSVKQHPSSTAITPQTSNASNLTPTQTGDRASLVDAPTWIETKATVVGYVKHPLEQLLEWLDLAMLWIEKRLAALWKKLRS